MKQAVFSALVGAAMATEADAVVESVMRRAPFSQQAEFNDFDMKRQVPEYASQANKGKARAEFKPNLRTGDELITLKERNAKKAERNPTLATRPDVKPLFKGSKD